MSARDVIEKAGAAAFAAFLDEYRIRAQNPGAGPASTRDWLEEACGRYRDTFLAALAAAGYVVVPRQITKAMAEAGQTAAEDALDSDWDSGADGTQHNVNTYLSSDAPAEIFAAMLAAAEAEAKEPTPSALQQAREDARIYGTGYYLVMPDGTEERVDPASVYVWRSEGDRR